MFLKVFKSGQPALLFFIPVLAILLWLKYFIVSQPVEMAFEPNPMPFYYWISTLLEKQIIIGKIVTLILLIFTGISLSKINTRFILLQHRSYLPAIIYLLLVSSYQPLQQLNPAVFASVFLVIAIEIIVGTYKKEGLALEFFMASFLIAIASLFYARAAFLILVIWTGLSIFRTIYWREWAFTILGFTTPYVFLFAWYYLSGQDMAHNWELIRYNFVHDRETGYLNYFYLGFYGYLLLVVLLASRKMLGNFQQLKIFIRKFFHMNFWIFVFVLIPFLVIYSRAIEMIYFLAIPVSYVLSYYFFRMRSKLAGEIIFGLLLAGYGMLLIFN
ncbi:hypothetical protein ACFLTA_02930 [Bacteroidota bacterium]